MNQNARFLNILLEKIEIYRRFLNFRVYNDNPIEYRIENSIIWTLSPKLSQNIWIKFQFDKRRQASFDVTHDLANMTNPVSFDLLTHITQIMSWQNRVVLRSRYK